MILSAAQTQLLNRASRAIGYDPRLNGGNPDLPWWVFLPVIGPIAHAHAIRRLLQLGFIERRERFGAPMEDLFITEAGREALGA